jgi:hypothetical protein
LPLTTYLALGVVVRFGNPPVLPPRTVLPLVSR